MQQDRQTSKTLKAATIPQSRARVHRSETLEALFSDIFLADYDTVLEGGGEEPEYLPGRPHRIVYTRDYFRSALHEVAHWCVAGAERRQRHDYGYWYAPDGRNRQQQAQFLQVEVHPQALEALFCAASGHSFRVSTDNLEGDAGDEKRFSDAVWRKARDLQQQGLAARPRRWCQALTAHYQRQGIPLQQGLAQTFQHP